MPGFARKRPIRAVLLATAVVAVSYSLARHHDHGPAQQVNAQLSTPASSPVADSSSDPWNPPIGIDRSNQAFDRLTFDLAAAPQTLYPASRFQAELHPVALPAETAQRADAPQPADVPHPADVSQHADLTAVPDEAPERPTALPAPTAPRAPRTKVTWRAEIDEYLWKVYQRSATKKDASGDFTWKDEAAAAKMGLVTKQYVIGGMDPDFRELLYSLGHAMDADGVSWTILSGFRDDYRQGLASGYKAHVGNSFHGGSRATGGYGHGCAADIEGSSGEGSSNNAVWRWVDQHGEKFGVFRPMKQIDPAHIQPFGAWHDVAVNLRTKDVQNTYLPASVDGTDAEKPPVTSLVETRSGVSEAQFDCVRHHGGFRLAGLSHHQHFTGGHMHRAALFHGGRLHRFGRRRMIVDNTGPQKHANLDVVPVADQPRAKAEASNRNRHDAVQHKVAGTGQEKRQGKEAAQSTDRVQRNANAQEAKGKDAKGKDTKPQTVAATKHPQKHAAADASEHHTKVNQNQAKAAGRNKPGPTKVGQDKLKNRVADDQDASSSKKL